MLIDFSVENFRSIRDEQRFSLVASNADKTLSQCVVAPKLPGISETRVLKGAAVYGANASGKSNLIKAIQFVRQFVLYSAARGVPEERIPIEPYKLDPSWTERPSKFEITFVARDGVRYEFGFSATAERVVEEYLYAFPKGREQTWYHRKYDADSGQYVWEKPSNDFKRDRSLEELTRGNSLFLSVAPQFNHQQLTNVFMWFLSGLRILGSKSISTSRITADQARRFENAGYRERIIRMLKNADLGIADLRIEVVAKGTRQVLVPSVDIKDGMSIAERPNVIRRVKLLHSTSTGTNAAAFDFEREESEGTRRLFSLLESWLDILDGSFTVFIDEIETSLHPLLVRELLKTLLSDKNEGMTSQVIFTTHNPLLMDTSILRRDQIWFTEKTVEGDTRLYPLTEFQPRRDEALAKGYLSGRYGAVPFIPDELI